MASTPPLRMISVREPPPTPRHGPKHDNLEPRYSTRSSQRLASREVKTTPEPQPPSRDLRSARTPESQRLAAHKLRHHSSPPISPHQSPKHNQAKRVSVGSPSPSSPRSGAHDTSLSNPSFASSSKQQSFLTSSAVMTDGMLPTPVKTPRKKAVLNANAAARALFQEKPNSDGEMMPTPKKKRKSRRYNGFSLESFSTANEAKTSDIQVYIDSRDNVPELDMGEENPFVDHPSEQAQPPVKRVDGASKRRKLTTAREKDPQVEEAIQNDEGMVYVFRGKKVFKRFDDSSEAEEDTTIDPNDLGLLRHSEASAASLRLLRPLTRKSIKPTRLFQTEEQKQAREAEKAEEAVTDIEEEAGSDVVGTSVSRGLRTDTRRPRRTVATTSPHTTHRAAANQIEDEVQAADGGASPAVDKVKKTKRDSPFDSWRRVKSAAPSSTATSGKGRKRASSVLEQDGEPSTGRKLRNR